MSDKTVPAMGTIILTTLLCAARLSETLGCRSFGCVAQSNRGQVRDFGFAQEAGHRAARADRPIPDRLQT